MNNVRERVHIVDSTWNINFEVENRETWDGRQVTRSNAPCIIKLRLQLRILYCKDHKNEVEKKMALSYPREKRETAQNACVSFHSLHFVFPGKPCCNGLKNQREWH